MAIGDVRVAALEDISYSCASFNGSNSNITFPKARFRGLSKFSVCFRLKFLEFDNTSNLIGGLLDTSNSAGDLRIEMRGNGKFKIGLDGVTIISTSIGASDSNLWVSWILTVGDGAFALYKNGILTDSGSSTGIWTATNNLTIGSYFNNVMYLKCKIRGLKIYEKVLSLTEIGNIASSMNISNSLYLNVPFIIDANDISGNSINGTSTNITFMNDNDTIATELTAARAGSSDKYLMTFNKQTGAVLTATINES